ncbi:MAG TPA: plasmid pRiA4b ORF-3 family protein [Crinalium sp.]|jgi:hypothetical protein
MKKDKQPFSAELYGDLLRSQSITTASPGLILKDFQTMLDYLQEHEVTVSGVNQLLQLKFLPSLNQRLSHPTDVQLKRPVQKSYPYINGLYLLLRIVGIAQILPKGKSQVLSVDRALLDAWMALNPTEQYFTLLEAWLMLADEIVIGEQGGGALNQPLYKLALFWSDTETDVMQFPTYQEQNKIHFIPGLHNLALLDLFGLLSIKTGKTELGQGWRIQHIQKLPLGEALMRLAIQVFQDSLNTWESAIEEGSSPQAKFGMLQPYLQPFFPEWQTVWRLPGEEFQDGTYTFKISLGKPWRRIAIPAALTLDDLAMAILDSFEFDADHLYEFTYKSRIGLECHILHPDCDEPPFTSDVRVGDLSLASGQSMTFLFDFGDNWQFKVELEAIAPPAPNLSAPTLLERHGKAPQQYPDYDESW